MDTIANQLGYKCDHIALKLGFTYGELQQFELKHPKDFYLRLRAVLNAWFSKEQNSRTPMLKALVDACTEAGVGGAAKRCLNYKDEQLS